MKFADIKKFPFSSYKVTVSLNYLEDTLDNYNYPEMGNPLIMNPDWQRGHVWTRDQQIAYVEYFLKGGMSGRDIYFNCSSWDGKYDTPIYVLDGLQRLTALLAFIHNDIPAFGCLYEDYEDKLRTLSEGCLTFNIMKLSSKKELLNFYIDANSGGTPHDPKEIKRVEKMMKECGDDETI